MRARTLLWLALCALGLASYVLIVERQKPSTDAQARRRNRLLPEFDRARLVGLRFVAAGRPVLALERRGEREWWISQPVRAPVDAAAMARLLATLELTEVLQPLAAGVSRAQRGLDPPRLRLTLLQRGGSPQTLAVGGADASDLGVYVALGDELRVVERSFAESVELEADALRERELVPWTAGDVESVEVLAGAGPRLRLRRSGRGFSVAAGEAAALRADPLAAERLIGALAALRVDRFSARPAGPAAWRVKVGAADRLVELELGVSCAGEAGRAWVGRRLGGALSGGCVDAEALQPLTLRAEQLVDTALLRSEEPELEGIVVRRPGKTLTLVRDGATWRVGAGGPPAEADALREWLAALGGWRGEVEAMADETRLRARVDGSVATLRFERARAAEAEVLRFGAPDARGRLAVRRGDEAAILWLPGAAAELLSDATLDLRERVALRVPREQLQRVVVAGPALREAIARGDAGWRVLTPEPGDVDRALVAALLDRLETLRIARWLPAWPRSAQLLAEVAFWGQAAIDAGPAPRPLAELLLARDADGRCLGRRAGISPFVLDEADCRLLLASKRERPGREDEAPGAP
ncbi:MAG: DUF4340 domain-containing protein [Proteobacteria bacterium]|nr:DUF4340 domain-containing protein [Pseudomonadota bacterium]